MLNRFTSVEFCFIFIFYFLVDRGSKTYTEDTPRLDGRILCAQGLDELGKLLGDPGGRVLAEKGSQLLLLVLGVGRIPLNRGGLALEPVRDEDLVLFLVAGG